MRAACFDLYMQILLTPLGVLTQTEESTQLLNESKMSVHMTLEKNYYVGGEESVCQKVSSFRQRSECFSLQQSKQAFE